LQQRSGGRRRSANVNRPDSARNILRRLARITAPQTKRRPSTPQVKPSTPAEKENTYSPFISHDDEDLENGGELERPDFTLRIEDEDDDAGEVPTRQELPGGEDYTFRSIDFATGQTQLPMSVRSERIRKGSRMSILKFPDEDNPEGLNDEEDITAQSIEYGRRAVSEGPAWDRYPRSSFGSIRMSEFGVEESGIGQRVEVEKSLMLDDDHNPDIGAGMDDEVELDDGYDESSDSLDAIADTPSGVTEDSRQFRQSISDPVEDGFFVGDAGFQDDENSFKLDFHRDDLVDELTGSEADARDGSESQLAASFSFRQSPSTAPQSPQSNTRPMTEIEAAAPKNMPRRKKLKLTRKGNTVPALPSSLVKRLAIDSMTMMGKKRPTINGESLAALEQATEWFFEQVGEDLEVYSDHAKRRRRVDDADVVTLMKRQRVIGKGRSLEDVAREFLPDEVLLDLHVPELG
jgi:histone H3/H4